MLAMLLDRVIGVLPPEWRIIQVAAGISPISMETSMRSWWVRSSLEAGTPRRAAYSRLQ